MTLGDSELIELVATRIMGWHLSPTGKTWRTDDNGWGHKSDWNPVMRRDEAWYVINVMRGRGFAITLTVTGVNCWATQSTAVFSGKGGDGRPGIATGIHAECKAICLAALYATGWEEQ